MEFLAARLQCKLHRCPVLHLQQDARGCSFGVGAKSKTKRWLQVSPAIENNPSPVQVQQARGNLGRCSCGSLLSVRRCYAIGLYAVQVFVALLHDAAATHAVLAVLL